MNTTFQCIVIGAGSAGLPAAMYLGRYKVKTLVIGAALGGALATSHCVENYPGIISDTGKSIMDNFAEHAKTFGAEIVADEVTAVEKTEAGFIVRTAMNGDYQAPFVLLATGNKYRHLGVPGERELLGRGVSYCATCDAMFFRDRPVAIVGGGDAAITEALYLSEVASEVHVIHRRDTFRAEDVWVEKLKARPNVTFHLNREVATLTGEPFLDTVTFTNGEAIHVDGIFVAVGSDPDTRLVEAFNLGKDASGCIVVDKRQQTSFPHLYAAGDVTTNSNKFKQTIMSAAEGSLAAHSIHEDLLRMDH